MKKLIFAILIFLLFQDMDLSAQCTEAKDPEMAKYKRLTETKDAQGCSQCGMLALYFCSAKYCVSVEDKRKVLSLISECKRNIRQMGEPYCCPEYLNQEPSWGSMVNGNSTSSGLQNNNSSPSNNSINGSDATLELVESKVTAAFNSFYAADAAIQARNNIKENTALRGTYNTIEELEAAVEVKLEAIKQSTYDLAAANNSLLQSGFDLLLNQSDFPVQAVGQIAVLTGSIINEVSAERKRKAAEEQLKLEKEKQINLIRLRKKDQILDLRREIFGVFSDGGLPLTFHKITDDQVYFFTYIIDDQSLNSDSTVVKVSNVFPVARFPDETWPNKEMVLEEIKKSQTGGVRLMGYYISASDAEKVRSSLLELLPKAQIFVENFQLKGSSSADNLNNFDFWGNEKPPTEKTGKGNRGIKPQSKKSDSFWDE